MVTQRYQFHLSLYFKGDKDYSNICRNCVGSQLGEKNDSRNQSELRDVFILSKYCYKIYVW